MLKVVPTFLMVVLCSCITQRFSFKPVQNKNTALQIDGYYYNTSEQTTSPFFNKVILYESGIVFYDEAINYMNFQAFESHISDSSYMEKQRNIITKWGLYKITGNTITIEIRLSDYYAPVMKFEGVIANDSTIQLTTATTKKNSYTISHALKLRAFPRPTGKNNFIK